MDKTQKVEYKRPSKWYYLGQLFVSIITLRLFLDWAKLLMYRFVNHNLGVKKAKIGASSKIHPTVIIREGERVEIGEGCLINHNNVIQGGKAVGRVVIGNYVHADVIIEDDVWIGAGSVITAGVRIGKGCVIGAGSVVTKDMPSNYVCAGVPCKPIKKRI